MVWSGTPGGGGAGGGGGWVEGIAPGKLPGERTATGLSALCWVFALFSRSGSTPSSLGARSPAVRPVAHRGLRERLQRRLPAVRTAVGGQCPAGFKPVGEPLGTDRSDWRG